MKSKFLVCKGRDRHDMNGEDNCYENGFTGKVIDNGDNEDAECSCTNDDTKGPIYSRCIEL